MSTKILAVITCIFACFALLIFIMWASGILWDYTFTEGKESRIIMWMIGLVFCELAVICGLLLLQQLKFQRFLLLSGVILALLFLEFLMLLFVPIWGAIFNSDGKRLFLFTIDVSLSFAALLAPIFSFSQSTLWPRGHIFLRIITGFVFIGISVSLLLISLGVGYVQILQWGVEAR